MLLCLALCIGLFPAAYAEDIVSADTEAAIIDAAEYDTPATEPADAEEPETESDDASELPALALSEPEESVQDAAELPNPVNVQFLTDAEEHLALLTVTDAFGVYQEPVTDPDTGAVCFGCYALLPGEYVWRFHDESGRYADLEESFTVEERVGGQFLTVYPDPVIEVFTASFTYINPIYADVITEDDIPRPSISEEELAAEMRDFLETMAYSGARTDARFGRNSGIYHPTAEAAGLELRQQIKDFEDEAIIYVACEEEPNDTVWNTLGSRLIEIAFTHTGNPTEGDYLRYEYGGYSAKGAYGGEPGSYYCSYAFSLNHFTNAEQEAELDRAAEDILKNLALDGKNDYEKISAIYRYLCTTVKGSGSGNLKYTAYGALVQKGALCQGFSSAFYRLCLASRVDTRMVTSSKMSHAWNIVKLGGRYYYLDATWDSNYSAANYCYFLKGSETWLSNHKTGGVSELGDQFKRASYKAQYPVPTYDYAPVIVKQPENCSVFAGRDVYIAVEATGGDLAYQWQTRKNEGETWQNVEGAAAAALSMPALLDDSGNLYRCIVSNSAGSLPTESVSLEVKDYKYYDYLNLSELIGLEFIVGGADCYDGLTISWTKKDGTQVTKNVTDGRFDADGNEYHFSLEKFSSKEMTVPIPVVIRDAYGHILKKTSCSVQSYCNKAESSEEEKYQPLRELCRAAMDYGTFAQIYFNYRTSELPNPDASGESLPSVPDSFKTSRTGTCTGIKGVTFALALRDKTDIYVYFLPESGSYTIDQYVATAKDMEGKTVDTVFSTLPDGTLCVKISGISARMLGNPYTVTLENKADKTQTVFSTAALGYAWKAQTAEDENLSNVCKALYNYYLKAKAFF